MAGDLRSQLILVFDTFPELRSRAGLLANVLLPLIEAYAVEREKAMRERCAKAVEAESPTRAHTGCVGSSRRTKHFPLSQDEWAAVVRAVPVDGEGTPEPKWQTS